MELGNWIMPVRIGNISDIKNITDNFKVLEFSVAEDNSYYDKKKELWVNRTVWHKIKAFNNRAEKLIQRLMIGDLVKLSGNLRYESWKQDEQIIKRAFIEFISMTLLYKVKDSAPTFTVEDIPF